MSAPIANNFSVHFSTDSFISILIFSWLIMGPVSKPSSICIKVTPVVTLPSKMAETTGDGPRYLGKREGCKFQHP